MDADGPEGVDRMGDEEEAYNLTAARLRRFREHLNPGDVIDEASGLTTEDVDRLIARIQIRNRVPYTGPERRGAWHQVDRANLPRFNKADVIDVFRHDAETYETVRADAVDWFDTVRRPLFWRRTTPRRRSTDRRKTE
jgi:hypothetical protein